MRLISDDTTITDLPRNAAIAARLSLTTLDGNAYRTILLAVWPAMNRALVSLCVDHHRYAFRTELGQLLLNEPQPTRRHGTVVEIHCPAV